MAHDAPQATGPSKLVIRNIGLLLSGALEKPILDADTIVAENGKITAHRPRSRTSTPRAPPRSSTPTAPPSRPA